MKKLRSLGLLLFAATTGAASCGDSKVSPTANCGCNSPATQILNRELAKVNYTGNDKDLVSLYLKVDNQYTYALVVCNKDQIPKAFLQDELLVRISGQHHKLCPDAGRAPGYPFTLTKIESDSALFNR